MLMFPIIYFGLPGSLTSFSINVDDDDANTSSLYICTSISHMQSCPIACVPITLDVTTIMTPQCFWSHQWPRKTTTEPTTSRTNSHNRCMNARASKRLQITSWLLPMLSQFYLTFHSIFPSLIITDVQWRAQIKIIVAQHLCSINIQSDTN